MDLSQYLDIFIEESKEHLQALNEQVLILEKEPDNADTINEIFRAAHSLKGMSGTMGYKKIQELTHHMENVFSEIRTGNMVVTEELVDVIFQGVDSLESSIDNVIETGDEGDIDSKDIVKALDKILEKGTKGAKKAASSSKPFTKAETISQEDFDEYILEDEFEEEYKHKDLKYEEFEINAIAKAEEKGLNIFGITIYLAKTCLLKAARSFMVYKSLGRIGEIIKSDPSVPDIEDEKFDFDFSMVFITKRNIDDIVVVLERISEIETVAIEEINSDEIKDKQKVSGISFNIGSYGLDEDAILSRSKKSEQASDTKDKMGSSAQKSRKSKGVANRSVRVDIEKLDELMNLVSELIISKNGLVSLGNRSIKDKLLDFNEQIEYLERVTTNIHESVMKVRMVPLENIFNRFPRMVRDLSKKLNKKIDLNISGEETELDRTVIDEIGDPLMHLIRNAADHGIETNEERIKLEKPVKGTINLLAYQEGNNVVIEVSDDGSGIDVEAVRNKAIEKGLFTKEQAATLKDEEIIDLLFQPSFSTTEQITDVSGRGVGLDVVRTNIQALSGIVEAKSTPGKGTKFTVKLPLTLAIMQALMISIGSEEYAIPISNVNSVEDILVSDLKQLQNKQVINLRDQVIPIVFLDKVINLEEEVTYGEELTVVIIYKGDKKVGIVINELIGQQEIVVKSIGKYINNDKIIGGATILGNGEVALILELNSLL